MKSLKISFGLISSIIIFSLVTFLFSKLDHEKDQEEVEKENFVFCDECCQY